ncbi:MAG: response regulator transcription factor [Campylobacterales bacterium]|nr:response regulator transcription factor [Campylobacterales bacterium]
MNETNKELLKNLTILLAEDDKLLEENLAITLGVFFKEVVVASNGAEALGLFEQKHIDIIMTDYVMPIIDGYSLCKEIRLKDPHIPIIIISNYSDREKLLRAIPLNLVSYMVKPISYDNLLKTFDDMLIKISQEKIARVQINETLYYDKYLKMLVENGKNIKLSNTEIIVLELFLKNKNKLLTNDIIEFAIHKDDALSYAAIKSLVYRLRKKIGKNTLINVQSAGYLLKIK